MKVFVSYKWEDEAHNAWVEQFSADLRSNGIDALLDRWEVRYGDSFTDYMTSAITNSDAVLFIMTPMSVEAAEAPSGKGGALKFEVQLATAKRIAGENFRLIGVLRKGDKIAAHVRDFRYVDFRDDQKYYEALISLVNDLLGLGSKPPIGGPPTSEATKEETLGRSKGTLKKSDFAESQFTDEASSYSSEKGGYIYRGFLYALPAFITLFSGYRLQVNAISSRDLLELSIPISFSPFFYLCYAYRLNKQSSSISSLLRREALYTQPTFALLYSAAVLLAVGGFRSPRIMWAFAVYVALGFGYGFYLLRQKANPALSVRHQLIWPPIFSYAITLYLGLCFSTLQVSAIPLVPVALLVSLFFLFELVPGPPRVSLIFALFLIVLAALILEVRRSGEGLLAYSLKSMLFCLCVAAYLAIFDAWRFTSTVSLNLNGKLSRKQSKKAVAKTLKFSTLTSLALTAIVCLLPFLFVFSEYGILFLAVFAVHATASIVLWFWYGSDLNKLRSLPWLLIKTVTTTTFIVGLVAASNFNSQPVVSVTRGLASVSGISLLQAVAALSLIRLLRSIQRIKKRSESLNVFIRVFFDKMNLVRLLSLASLVSVFVVVPLIQTLSPDSRLRSKADLAFCVYTLFILLSLVLEIINDVSVLPRSRRVPA